MPPTLSVAVVYGTVSGALRRIIDANDDPNDGAIFRAQANLQPGESIITFTRTIFPPDGAGDFIINRDTIIPVAAQQGVTILPPVVHAVVPGSSALEAVGQVVANVVCADPNIDSVPGSQLIPAGSAGIGWTWNGTTFTAPIVTTVAPTSGSITP